MKLKRTFLIFCTLCCCLTLLASAVSALRLPEGEGGAFGNGARPAIPRLRTLPSYNSIIARNPFGITATNKQPAIATLPKVSGLYRLVGTVAQSDGTQSVAIIEKKGGEQGVFFEGDSVFGAMLVSIRAKAVVLRRNSRLEVLAMEGEEDLPAIAAIAKKPATPVNSKVTRKGNVSRKDLAEMLKSPAKLAREITLIPGRREGRSGLLVRAVRRNGMLEQLGLQRGDLLLSANGKPFSIRNGAARLIGLLKEDNVAVNILRGKQQQQLAITIQ